MGDGINVDLAGSLTLLISLPVSTVLGDFAYSSEVRILLST